MGESIVSVSSLLILRPVFIIFFLLMVVACGGGSSGGDGQVGDFNKGAGGNPADLNTADINSYVDNLHLSALFVVSMEVANEFPSQQNPGQLNDVVNACFTGTATYALNVDASRMFSGTLTFHDYDNCSGLVVNGVASVSGRVQNNTIEYYDMTFTNLGLHSLHDGFTYRATGALHFEFRPNLAAGSEYTMIVNTSFFDARSRFVFELENYWVDSHMTAGQQTVHILGRLADGDFGYVDVMTLRPARVRQFDSGLSSLYVLLTTDNLQARVEVVSGQTGIQVGPIPTDNNSVDASFGTGGVATLDFNSSGDSVVEIHLLSDGKILAAGTTSGNSDRDFALARFNGDGSVDSGFSDLGKVTIDAGSIHDTLSAMAVQDDGKIVLAGTSNLDDLVVARMNADGSTDAGFGANGKVTTSFGNRFASVYDVTVLSSGKILASGAYFDGVMDNFALARYNSDGTLDATFGASGIVLTQITRGFVFHNSVIEVDNGQIIVCGTDTGQTTPRIVMIRYNENGSIDTTFGNNSVVEFFRDVIQFVGAYINKQADGKYVVASLTSDGTGNAFTLVRFNSDGSVDTSFGTDGLTTHKVNGGSSGIGRFVIQSDGKYLLTGTTPYGINDLMTLVRFNSDGSVDQGFAVNGVKLISAGVGDTEAKDIAIQTDNKIIVGGTIIDGNSDFGLVRISP